MTDTAKALAGIAPQSSRRPGTALAVIATCQLIVVLDLTVIYIALDPDPFLLQGRLVLWTFDAGASVAGSALVAATVHHPGRRYRWCAGRHTRRRAGSPRKRATHGTRRLRPESAKAQLSLNPPCETVAAWLTPDRPASRL
jgi:hypothetical protein